MTPEEGWSLDWDSKAVVDCLLSDVTFLPRATAIFIYLVWLDFLLWIAEKNNITCYNQVATEIIKAPQREDE